MNEKQLKKFEAELEKRGYRKYSAYNSADYAWFKSFGKSQYQEGRSNYQIAFSVYDFSRFGDRDAYLKKNPYRCLPAVMVSRTTNERLDMELATIDYKEIERVEKVAESFYQWAEQNVEYKEKRYGDL